ncbi:SPOR domain-containing protein [Sphingomicrobium sp. XHP0239]|uniref:SPOR domain-containing protein n=1 Tax=Sphingomicrobium maritimum TaxID=3133972 RepID=UPI0031CCD505
MRIVNRKRSAKAALAAATALTLGLTVPGAAHAQQSGNLTESLKTLENSPRDLDALLDAGRQTLEIGDLPSAAAFYGRAAEIRPGDPRVLAGLGTLAAYMNQADKALDYFDRASGAGGSDAQIGAGRGLAFDLTGNRDAAEVNYRAALRGPDAQAAARRLALNLAMEGDRAGAIALINPQISAGDTEALRARAFILALTGDTENARRAIESVMPGSGDAIEPFLRMLPRLSDRQKAAAVHLGIFPTENDVEYANAAPSTPRRNAVPIRSARSAGERVAVTTRSTSPERERLIEQVGRSNVVTDVPEQRSSPRYRLDIPTEAQERAGARPRRVRIDDDPAEVVSQSRALERSTPIATASRGVDASADGQGRLASIDQLLASDPAATPEPVRPRVAEVAVPAAPTPKFDAPPPPRPKYEAPPAPTPKVERPRPVATVAATSAASDIGVAGTHFVQLAGSDDRDAMTFEWRRITSRANGALTGRDALLTRGASFHRLLVGPFDSRTEAQELVNRLRAEGVDSFAWTRNPSRLRIDRL